jgi:very-short-patch-repair endonuclease
MSVVYDKIPNSILAQFSTLKFVQGSNFNDFKDFFLAKYLGGFVVPANSFDNVKGSFPIGFTIWNLHIKEKIENIVCDIYDKNLTFLGKKQFWGDLPESINKWVKLFDAKKNPIGLMVSCAPDFQHNKQLAILSQQQQRYCFNINENNIIPFILYFSVRHSIDANWLNDRDQFFFPVDGWEKDKEFQNDCLAFTLFHSQNRISNSPSLRGQGGVNHWIPFTESEVNAREKFESNFMSKFISGKHKKTAEPANLFSDLQNSPSLMGLETDDENSPSLRGSGGVKITPEYLQSNGISTKGLIFSDLYLPYNPNLKNNSRNLRKAGNLSEVLLWKELRADKFLGYSFYRQKPILNYIVDFYCKELGLVIEIDGSSHDDKIEYDTERDRQMSVLGLTVLRIKDADVKKDMQNVLRVIENQIGELTPPNPLREGELTPPKPLKEKELTPPNPLTEGELKFSPEATEVFDAGRELWKYYHSQPNCNVNASLYDIREHFQGRNDKGKMNNKSKDESYMKLITNLRDKLKRLAQKIEPKVYEYGFLKE